MRTALFSDKEREMVKQYLETGEKDEGFSVLVHRCRRGHTQIKEDLVLLNQLLQRLNPTP